MRGAPHRLKPDGNGSKEAQARLAQMETKHRELLEAIPDAMLVTTLSGDILLLNHRAEKRFGYGRDELVGQKVTKIIPAGFAERITANGIVPEAEALENQIDSSVELTGRRKNGSAFPIEIILNPLESADGTLVIVAIRDISTRKEREADMTRMEDKYRVLQEAERLKDEFVSTVSHELRTPLTSISGSLGLLMTKSAGPLPDSAVRLIEIAHRSSQRLVRLVSDILDIKKMEYGMVVFTYKRIDLRALVELAIEANRGLADTYGVQIRLEDGGLSIVRADSDRLIQVVTNLLSNAIKFTPRNTEVTVAIENAADIVLLSVRDQGPGISAEFASRIFGKFSQADASSARPKDGTGLGLSIVKQIAERLGGKVGFEAAPGGGTIFTVELPSWEQGERIAIDPDTKPASSRILLCEDDPYTSIALRDQLQHVGFATDFAYDASEALAYAGRTNYRAVLVDLLLPEGDGISLIRNLRELPNYADTPIIVVSAEAKRGREDERASTLNVLDWLNKPVDFDHLKRVLIKPAANGARASN